MHQSPDLGEALGSTFNFAQSGVQYLDLSGGVGGGGRGNYAAVNQKCPTVPDVPYLLTFYIGSANEPEATINVKVNGASLLLDETLTAEAPEESDEN